jgi:hypothetical protein
MAKEREIEPGALFRKVGVGQPIWRVDSFLRHASLPHAKLKRLDSPSTQMTVAVAALVDPRFFERIKPE